MWPKLRIVRNHFPVSKQDLTRDGHRFDSMGELKRYASLKMMMNFQIPATIRDLIVHPKLPMVINGKKIGRGYITLDFHYSEFVDGEWREVWEDFKPVISRESKIRIQVCEAIHGISVRLTQ